MNRTMKLAGVLLVAVFLIAMLFPFFWIFITSFKSTGEIYGEGAFRVIPREPTLQNYLTVLFEKGILNAVKNSFIVAGTTTVYIIAVATL